MCTFFVPLTKCADLIYKKHNYSINIYFFEILEQYWKLWKSRVIDGQTIWSLYFETDYQKRSQQLQMHNFTLRYRVVMSFDWWIVFLLSTFWMFFLNRPQLYNVTSWTSCVDNLSIHWLSIKQLFILHMIKKNRIIYNKYGCWENSKDWRLRPCKILVLIETKLVLYLEVNSGLRMLGTALHYYGHFAKF